MGSVHGKDHLEQLYRRKNKRLKQLWEHFHQKDYKQALHHCKEALKADRNC